MGTMGTMGDRVGPDRPKSRRCVNTLNRTALALSFPPLSGARIPGKRVMRRVLYLIEISTIVLNPLTTVIDRLE